MKKQHLIYVGIGLGAIALYFVYKNRDKVKSFLGFGEQEIAFDPTDVKPMYEVAMPDALGEQPQAKDTLK